MRPAITKFVRFITVVIFLLAAGNGAEGAVVDQLYWTEWEANQQTRICHANLDGSSLTVIARGSGGNVGIPPYNFGPAGIAVDVPAGYVYWTDINGNKITRSGLDGSNKTTIGTSTDPRALVLDPRHGTFYWSDTEEGRIYMANLDGGQAHAIVTAGIITVEGLAVDSLGEKLYWTDVHTDSIKRANLDGTNVETLVSGFKYQAPSGLALDLTRGKMYWADWATYRIHRANLDGSSVEDFVTGLDHPGPLTIDPLYQSLYCLDWGSGQMLHVDLSTRDVATIATFSGVSSFSGIAYARAPEPGGIIVLVTGAIFVLAGYVLRITSHRARAAAGLFASARCIRKESRHRNDLPGAA